MSLIKGRCPRCGFLIVEETDNKENFERNANKIILCKSCIEELKDEIYINE